MSEARLKPGGVVLIVGFALAVVGFGLWTTVQQKKQQAGNNPPLPATSSGQPPVATTGAPPPATEPTAVPLASGGKFEEVGKQAIPQVTQSGKYAWNDADPTVVFPINVWAGWGPIIAANGGFAPDSPDSVFKKKYGFKVELRLIDDPGAAANEYAAGKAHTLWGTLDMIALFAPQLQKAGLTPKVFQQVDWSAGGDGIVVRAGINTVADLKGKTIALCQNSPSHFYLLQLLKEVGLSARDVNMRFTSTAFGASALFAQDRSVHACVSWAPDIYVLVDPKNNPGRQNRLLSTTADANRLIADVWAARPDFAQEHPQVIEGLVKGIFEGVRILRDDPDRVATLMAAGYTIPVDDCKGMLRDAYSTGMGDNELFFLTGAERSVNFAATWKKACEVYAAYGAIDGAPVPAEQVMDASVIRRLKEAGEFSDQAAKEEKFEPLTVDKAQLEHSLPEVLRVPMHVQFRPNEHVLDETYDPTIPKTLQRIKELAEQFGAARIVIEGNTDTSRKAELKRMGPRVFAEMSQAVQELSEKRAQAMREAVMKLMPPGTDPNKIIAFGNGWENPIDPVDHVKNRRADIRVLPVE
jgi:NitT/TauT family transport system substrate-binding protein